MHLLKAIYGVTIFNRIKYKDLTQTQNSLKQCIMRFRLNTQQKLKLESNNIKISELNI